MLSPLISWLVLPIKNKSGKQLRKSKWNSETVWYQKTISEKNSNHRKVKLWQSLSRNIMKFWTDLQLLGQLRWSNAIILAQSIQKHLLFVFTSSKTWRGTAPLDLIFEDFVYFLKKLKQLRKRYQMNLIRNIQRNSKTTVLFQ